MAGARISVWSWAAAVTLAGVTLSLFYALQNYGPESAVRRFHDAVARRDASALQQVTQQSVEDQSVGEIVRTVLAVDPSAQNYRLGPTQRQPKVVVVETIYAYRGRFLVSLPWVVEKRGTRTWRINAPATAQKMRGYLGTGG